MGKGNGISVSYDFPDRWRSLDLRPSVLEEAQTPPHYRRRFGRGGAEPKAQESLGKAEIVIFPSFPPFLREKGDFLPRKRKKQKASMTTLTTTTTTSTEADGRKQKNHRGRREKRMMMMPIA